MKAYIAFFFHHRHYSDVMSKYKTAFSEHKEAVEVCSQYYSYPQDDSFETKEKIASILPEIKEVSSWISTYRSTKFYKTEGLRWFFNERGLQDIPEMDYQNYKTVIENLKAIGCFQDRITTYKTLMSQHKEAVDRLLGISKSSHSYDEITRLAFAEDYIKRISSILSIAHHCEACYKQAWKIFAKGRLFEKISIETLQTINKDHFKIKEQFLSIYSQKSELIKLILGQKHVAIESFSKDVIKQEKELIALLSSSIRIAIDTLEGDVTLAKTDKLKRAILDSVLYGEKCSFTDSFTISDFYELRKNYDLQGIAFDDAVRKAKDNDEAIREYNKERCGKYIVYIEDYLQAMTVGSDLYNYIERYKHQKLQIEAARKKEAERQAESDRKLAELRVKNTLLSKVSEWPLLRGSLHYNYLLRYFPTTCDFDANESEWEDRWTVWNFKNTPGKTSSEDHEEALDTVVPRIKHILTSTFGKDNLKKLTLVCIPASSAVKTELRYEEFSSMICGETGMQNAYDHIKVISSSTEKKFGGMGITSDNLSFDNGFFKGKYVILFDDVVTKGDSMLRFKHKMESLGAVVICGLSIGKTTHTR